MENKKKDINHFSINDEFWLTFNESLVSFGFKSLPPEIHFTLSFNEKSEDFNLHLTKNTSNPKDKPHVKIFVANKQELIDSLDLPVMIQAIIDFIFEPLDIAGYIEEHGQDTRFLPWDLDGEKPIWVNDFTKTLFAGIQPITSIKKKTRLKIKGDLEECMENIVEQGSLKTLMDESTIDITDHFTLGVNSGLLVSQNESIFVIKLFDQWYSQRRDFNYSALIDPSVLKLIRFRIKRTLVAFRSAQCYNDTKNLNASPIRLCLFLRERVDG